MKFPISCLLTVTPILLSLCFAHEAKAQGARERAWSKYLKKQEFRFPEDELGMISSLQEFAADCQLHIVYDPPPRRQYVYRIVRNGKRILSINGNITSVFRTFDNKLYFARFGDIQPGCDLIAYDLMTGKQLWKSKELSGLGPIGHSAYGNQVRMKFSSEGQVPNEREAGAIIVTGQESYGDYMTIVESSARGSRNPIGRRRNRTIDNLNVD